METPLLTVIVPTVGRPSLARTGAPCSSREWLPGRASCRDTTPSGPRLQARNARPAARNPSAALRRADGGCRLATQRNFLRHRGGVLLGAVFGLGDDDVHVQGAGRRCSADWTTTLGALRTSGRLSRNQDIAPGPQPARLGTGRWAGAKRRKWWHEAPNLGAGHYYARRGGELDGTPLTRSTATSASRPSPCPSPVAGV
jgi:hypothetical protein